jgi:Ulp1 family protease
MIGQTLTTSVEIQMSLIYGKGKSVVPVKIPKVQQQQNSIDCGVFAIAFMVAFRTGIISNSYNEMFEV